MIARYFCHFRTTFGYVRVCRRGPRREIKSRIHEFSVQSNAYPRDDAKMVCTVYCVNMRIEKEKRVGIDLNASEYVRL